MTDVDGLKERVCEQIDENAEEIVSLAKSVQDEPELGFKEEKTTEKVADALTGLGLDVETDIAVTGTRARYGETGEDPFVFAVLGELDALVNPSHPKADPETGACHACGHHAQVANMVGAAFGLVGADVLSDLSGAIEFLGVPAEEYLDLEFRRSLVESGEIEFLGGKQELLRRGYFDGVDCAAMIHAGSETPEREIGSRFSNNGFVGKFVTYEGVESHAGAAPEEGINALNAAMQGMSAIHANRETFADEDHVRVHPMLTKGGDGVNVVPADVRMESYVRAKTVEAIDEANEKTNRALESGAMAVGAGVTIDDYPGYMPFRANDTLVETFEANARDIVDGVEIDEETHHFTGSTDMGDVTQVVPGVHPHVGGFAGAVHSKEFEAVDEEMAYVLPAKITACLVVDVLADSEKRAAIREAKDGKMSVEEYLETVRPMRDTVAADYRDDADQSA